LLKGWATDLASLHAVLSSGVEPSESALEEAMTDYRWQQVAQLHWNDVGFDDNVSELMGRKFPGARVAAPVAVTKMAVEMPLLRAVYSTPDAYAAPTFPTAPAAARIATSKAMVETPMMRAFSNLSGTVLMDTVQNNYMRRTKILTFLSGSGRRLSLSQVNDWVYAGIFLTPRQDPWLGLAPADVFTGIDGNGERDSRLVSASR